MGFGVFAWLQALALNDLSPNLDLDLEHLVRVHGELERELQVSCGIG